MTLHLPPAWYPPASLTRVRGRTWFNCVSQAEERAYPPGVNLVPTIPNGMPVDALVPAEHGCRGYAVMLGRTGFLVEDVDSMAKAIAEIGQLDRALCRRVAEERFSVRRMAAAYLALYQRLAAA